MLDGGLLQSGAKPGDVLKAEADFELEGITITSVVTPKDDHRPDPQRIEVVGPGRPEGPGVTTQLFGRPERRPGGRRSDRDRGPRRERERPGGAAARRETPERTGADRRRPRRAERPGGAEQAPGPAGDAPRVAGPGQAGAPRGERRGGMPTGPGRDASDAGRPRAHRLNPGSAHRRAVMQSLPPEQQPIAEQVLRGGIPAVRTALHLEREKAQAEGRPAPNTDELIVMAEGLLPRLRAAEWRDRAEAAAAAVEEISMRDLRSVVAGADLARDDETRALAATLREALQRRVDKLRSDWSGEIQAHLDGGKVVRALRLSGRPPEPSARLDAGLAERLASAAGEAMAPAAPPDLWAALLEAAAGSPVRRSIVPAGLADNAPPDLKRAAHQFSGAIPALAKLLGVAIPPPPPPVGARRRAERAAKAAGVRPGRKPPPAAQHEEAPPQEDPRTVGGPATGGDPATGGGPAGQDTP